MLRILFGSIYFSTLKSNFKFYELTCVQRWTTLHNAFCRNGLPIASEIHLEESNVQIRMDQSIDIGHSVSSVFKRSNCFDARRMFFVSFPTDIVERWQLTHDGSAKNRRSDGKCFLKASPLAGLFLRQSWLTVVYVFFLFSRFID